MSFRVSCPKCRTAAACPDEYRGRSLRCKKCGQPFVAGATAARRPTPTARPAPTPEKPPRRFLIAAIIAALIGAGVGFPVAYFLLKKDTPPDAVTEGPTTPTSTDTLRGSDTARVVPPAATTKQDS